MHRESTYILYLYREHLERSNSDFGFTRGNRAPSDSGAEGHRISRMLRFRNRWRRGGDQPLHLNGSGAGRATFRSPEERAMNRPWIACLLASLACATTPEPSSNPGAAVTAQPDRSPKDVARDAQRKPLDTLAFFGTKPGMRVAELGAGGGYTTELVARTVGPTGQVFAQNVEAWGGPEMDAIWNARLAQPVNKPVVRVTRGWEEPLPPEARNLDAVYSVMVYHDVIAEKADPVRMNRAVFEALKAGGRYVIIDNSAVAGSGPEIPNSLHRVDEGLVRKQVEAAGFKFDSSADFLRNTSDTRNWAVDPPPAGPQAHTQDRFALRFVKP